MSLHRTYPSHRRRAGRNWFGDGSLGYVRVTSTAAQQSTDGVVWSAIPGWTLAGSVVTVPSTTDGDMVVLNCKTLDVAAGMTLTTSSRCRGLLIYVQGNCVYNGTGAMTARGPHANPADSGVTVNTPVAPSDGHAVPADGITIRRFASGYTDSDTDDDLMWGCGLAAVTAEAHQPKVRKGIVIRIPRIGGAGVAASTAHPGPVGGTLTNAPGGGGRGSGSAGTAGASTAATCFSGGVSSGGASGVGSLSSDAAAYGGAASAGNTVGGTAYNGAGGGAGNPAGAPSTGGVAGVDGAGGLLILVVGGNLIIAGALISAGSNGGNGGAGGCGGGGSGAGAIVVLYAGTLTQTGTINAPGGTGGTAQSGYNGGAGGAGTVLGPYKIDPA